MAAMLAAVRRTLARLELDPYGGRRPPRHFSTPEYEQVRMTPVGTGEWSIYWMAGPGEEDITIIEIADASV